MIVYYPLFKLEEFRSKDPCYITNLDITPFKDVFLIKILQNQTSPVLKTSKEKEKEEEME